MTLTEIARRLEHDGLWLSWTSQAEQKHHETFWTFKARVQRGNKVLTEARADTLYEAKCLAYQKYEQLPKE